MAKSYVSHIKAGRTTPQTKRARQDQIKNRAGGYGFQVDIWGRLQRFLILGCDGGTYYAGEKELVFENYDVLNECLKADYARTINTIVEISKGGRAVKNAPAVFALAVAAAFGNDDAKAMAYKVMPEVSRYSTDFFTFIANVIALKSGKKGMGLRRAICRWYNEKNPVQLAYQLCKYPGRSVNGKRWAHGDLLRLARPTKGRGKSAGRNGRVMTIPTDDHATLYQYATHGVTTSAEAKALAESAEKSGQRAKAVGISTQKLTALRDSKLKYVYGHEKAKIATSVKQIVDLVNEFKLTRESIPPQFRNELEVQRALLTDMPMTALIRNLGQYTSSGLLKPLGDETALVVEKIGDTEVLKKARVHPMTIMLALKIYQKGSGYRSTWKPVSQIVEAMEDAFYASFEYVEPTGKKYLVASDSSGSMWWNDGAHKALWDTCGILSAEAAAVVAMAIGRSEKNAIVKTFASGMKDWNITRNDTLESAVRKLQATGFGGTDCAAPMKYAMANKLDVDVFVVLTDNETWAGDRHPFEALQQYRAKFNKDARLATLSFAATNVSIADPTDAGMIDFVGLDSNVPKLLAEFALGQV